jgi:hypothetical protein
MRRALILLAVLGAAAVAVLGLRRTSSPTSVEKGGEVRDAHSSPDRGQAASPAESDRRVSAPTNSPPAAAVAAGPFARGSGPGGRAGAVLEDFYGERWPELREQLAKRIDLDLALDRPLLPWESVRPRLADAMRVSDAAFARWQRTWLIPRPLTLDFLGEQARDLNLELDERDLDAVEAQVVDACAESEFELTRLRAIVDGLLRSKYQRGQYQYGPFATIASDLVPSPAFYMDSVAIDDWTASWGIAVDEDPEIAPILAGLRERKARMLETIESYLSKLPR